MLAMAFASGCGKPSGSASSIVADRTVGYHDLKIDGFLLTVGAPTALPIKSRPFTVGGHRWRILFSSGGLFEYVVGLYLVLDVDNIVAKSVTAQVQFSVTLEKRALFFVKWEKKKILSSSDLKTHGAGICTEWSGMAKSPRGRPWAGWRASAAAP
jgi:speckle-type POZ protein